VLDPDAGHCHVRDVPTECGSQCTRRSLRVAVRRCVLGRTRQQTRLNTISDVMSLTPRVIRNQTDQPITGKAFAPAVEKLSLQSNLARTSAHVKPSAKSRISRALHAESARPFLAAAACCLLLMFHDFALGQFHRNLHGRNNSSDSNVGDHQIRRRNGRLPDQRHQVDGRTGAGAIGIECQHAGRRVVQELGRGLVGNLRCAGH
jgi:hypothetical protein